MRWQAILSMIALLGWALGPGTTVVPAEDEPCGTPLPMQADGTFEAQYTWEGQPGDYGAFAECYEGTGEVCAIIAWVTKGPEYYTYEVDVFVWSDAGGQPGELLAVERMVPPSNVPPYIFTEHRFYFTDPPCVEGTWWAGYKPHWNPFVGADLDGPGQGCPMTNVPPGLGYPPAGTTCPCAGGRPGPSESARISGRAARSRPVRGAGVGSRRSMGRWSRCAVVICEVAISAS